MNLKEQLGFPPTGDAGSVLQPKSRILAKKQIGTRMLLFKESVVNSRIRQIHWGDCRSLLSARLEEFDLISVEKRMFE